jgi:deoxyhypusine synthase
MQEISGATSAVLVQSAELPSDSIVVAGKGVQSSSPLLQLGFQATNLGKAIHVIQSALETPNLTLFLGLTANLMATGIRSSIAFLVEHAVVDILVVSAGGMESDLQRCLGSAAQEHLIRDYLKTLADEQREAKKLSSTSEDPVVWAITPSAFWSKLGRFIDSLEDVPGDVKASSVLVQASRKGVPIYSPNFSDGDIYESIKTFNQDCEMKREARLCFDLVRDIGLLNRTAMKAKVTAAIILGGGVVKHHICNANLMRNGADFAVFINNAQEFDGSDAGARPDEAVSWGKIKLDGKSAKVYAEVTTVWPLVIQQAFLPFIARRMRQD